MKKSSRLSQRVASLSCSEIVYPKSHYKSLMINTHNNTKLQCNENVVFQKKLNNTFEALTHQI